MIHAPCPLRKFRGVCHLASLTCVAPTTHSMAGDLHTALRQFFRDL